LQTADVFHFVREFAEAQSETRIERASDLTFAAYSRMMNRSDLQEKRFAFYGDGVLNLLHHRNVFETGEMLSPQGTEDAVFGQTVAAVLLDVIENAFSARYEHALSNVSVRVDLYEMVSVAAERTLERMRIWQQGMGLRTRQVLRVFEHRLSELDRREEHLWERFASSTFSPVDAVHLTDTEQFRTEHHERSEFESEIDSRQFDRTLQTIARERREIEVAMQRASAMPGDTFFSLLSSVYENTLQEGGVQSFVERTLALLSENALLVPGEVDETISLPERHLLSVLTQEDGEIFDEVLAFIGSPALRSDTPEVAVNDDVATEIARTLLEYLPGSALERPDTAVSAERILLAGEEAETPRTEGAIQTPGTEDNLIGRSDLKETLDEYDRRNKAVAQRIADRARKASNDRSGEGEPTEIGQNPEHGASDEADIMIQNLLEEARMQGRDVPLPPELILLLAEAEPQSRDVYEKVLRYINNPVPAPEEDGARRLGVLEFNSEIERIRDHAQAEMQHRESETRVYREELLKETTRTIEHTQHDVAGKRSDGSRLGSLRPVRRIHRPGDFGHEAADSAAAEAVTAPKIEREVHKQETIVHKTLSETEVNRIVRESQVRSAEEISELLNHALSRQLGAISNRVYNQVERRLRLERARRGK
jgi:hypothetical protein